jgi:hypothetical protein
LTKALIDYWSDHIEHLLKTCANDRNLLHEQHIIDVAISTHEPLLKNSVNF